MFSHFCLHFVFYQALTDQEFQAISDIRSGRRRKGMARLCSPSQYRSVVLAEVEDVVRQELGGYSQIKDSLLRLGKNDSAMDIYNLNFATLYEELLRNMPSTMRVMNLFIKTSTKGNEKAEDRESYLSKIPILTSIMAKAMCAYNHKLSVYKSYNYVLLAGAGSNPELFDKLASVGDTYKYSSARLKWVVDCFPEVADLGGKRLPLFTVDLSRAISSTGHPGKKECAKTKRKRSAWYDLVVFDPASGNYNLVDNDSEVAQSHLSAVAGDTEFDKEPRELTSERGWENVRTLFSGDDAGDIENCEVERDLLQTPDSELESLGSDGDSSFYSNSDHTSDLSLSDSHKD